MTSSRSPEPKPACVLAIATAVWALASPAAAQAFDVYVVGSATVRDAAVEVTCDDGPDDEHLQCEARTRYQLHADGEVELSVRSNRASPRPGVELGVWIDGERVTERVSVAIGQTVSVEVVGRSVMPREPGPVTGAPDFEDEPFYLSAIRTRHPFLGHHLPSDAATSPYDEFVGAVGPDLRVVGPVRHLTDGARHVAVTAIGERDEPTLGVVTTADRPGRELVHGGPFLALGGAVGWEGHPPDPRFAVRVGYEVGLVDVLVAGLAFESDLESIAESLVLEVASSEIWFLLPSFGAGVGVVARQLGSRDADAALRLRGTITWALVGFMMDFDYWPSIGGWTGTFLARFGF
ncbi:MAG: hypothetical protein H6719_20440 [Sandaracinaceae bacterium]|nr:hypothetical protein [Sandaracinaceae bacterium]